MKKLLFLTILGMFAFAACKKENFETFTPKDTFETTLVKASFSGIIVDENEKGLENVEVSNGSHKTTTDKNGVFFFTNIEVPSHKAYFVASKAGYFQGSRTLFAQAGQTHPVRIKMLSSTPIGSFSNATGGVINLPEGGQLTFEAGDVALPNGTAYNGTVNVAAKKIDPTQTNGRYEMPGDLRGINANEENVVLQSYGMMAVELTDQSGNLLQVAPNQSVGIQVDVPNSLSSTAPTSIPLWYFDETNGDWKEEGSATLSGNTYQGEVSHFSFWNYDVQFPSVFFEAHFVDANGNPLVNQLIYITIDGWTTYGITNNDGWVGGIVMADASLKISIVTQCGIQYIMDIITTTEDVNLGTIAVNADIASTHTITGTVVNCDNLPITNGYLQISTDNWFNKSSIFIDSDNNFSIGYTSCEDVENISIIAYDYDSFSQTDIVELALTTDINIGNLQACGNTFDEFFTVNFVSPSTGNDTTITHFPPAIFGSIIAPGSDSTSIQLGFETANITNILYIENVTLGPATYNNVWDYMNVNGMQIYFTPDVQITAYPENVGDYFEGVILANGNTPEITGSFRIKRQ